MHPQNSAKTLETGTVQMVYVTAPNRDAAMDIAKTVVNERLAACANIIDSMTSVYWWDGALQEDQEAVLLLKTSRERVETLTERIKAVHSYDCPCVVSFAIENGNTDFVNWIIKETA